MTHLKVRHSLSRNYIFLSGGYRDLSDREYKCVIQFFCPLFCCHDQLCHSDKRIFSVSHHRCARMVAHAFCRYLIVDDADDSADNSHIDSRMIEFIALFDMIFQITLILADISLGCFCFFRTAAKLC